MNRRHAAITEQIITGMGTREKWQREVKDVHLEPPPFLWTLVALGLAVTPLVVLSRVRLVNVALLPKQRTTKFLSLFEHFCHKQLAHLGRVVLRAVVLEATVEAALLDLGMRKIKKTYSNLVLEEK